MRRTEKRPLVPPLSFRRHIIALLLVTTWLFAFSHDGLELAGLAPAHHLHLGHHHYGHEHAGEADPHSAEHDAETDGEHAPFAARGSVHEIRLAVPALWLLALLPLSFATLLLARAAAAIALCPSGHGRHRRRSARLNLWLFDWRCAPDAVAPPAAA